MAEFMVRQARPDDAQAMAQLLAAVAEERDGIATEPPVDVNERAGLFARAAARRWSQTLTVRLSG